MNRLEKTFQRPRRNRRSKTGLPRRLAKRRCLIPATGFYEWSDNAANDKKQPHHFHLPNNEIFCFAGLWETCEMQSPKQAELFDVPNNFPGTMLQTFTILTTSPNKLVSKYHNRMPVMKLNAVGDWINEGGIGHESSDQIPLIVQQPNQS